MEIKYLGHSSFLIKTKEARLVTDPFSPQAVGFDYPKVWADIVIVSHQHKDHNQVNLVSPPKEGEKLIINWPGEFEKKGIRIFGYETYHDKSKGKERGGNIVYKIEADDISILHCGDLGEVLSDSLVDRIGEVDVMMVPIGGTVTIDSQEAVNLIKKFSPSIVIPMHYRTKKHSEEFEKLTDLKVFLDRFGNGESLPQEKLVIKKENLEEKTRIVVLE